MYKRQDLLELARAIVRQYDKDDYWENLRKNKKWGDLKEKDLEIIKEAFKPFDNNRYKMKWFNNINQWFKNWNNNFNWNWNWQDCYNWYDKDDWDDFDWDDWYKWYKDNGNSNKDKNKNKK